MGKTLFVIGVAASSSILSLIITAIIGTYFVHGEGAIGIGYMWALSFPVIIILSIVSLFLYGKYLTSKNNKSRTALYVSIILAVTLMAPVLTFAVLNMIKI